MILTIYIQEYTDLMHKIKKCAIYKGKTDEEILFSIGAYLLKFCLLARYNAFSVSEPLQDQPFASALYPSLSMVNHSCLPNTVCW